jgi:hypothetical protein
MGEEAFLTPGAGHRGPVVGCAAQGLDVGVGPALGGEFGGRGVQLIPVTTFWSRTDAARARHYE